MRRTTLPRSWSVARAAAAIQCSIALLRTLTGDPWPGLLELSLTVQLLHNPLNALVLMRGSMWESSFRRGLSKLNLIQSFGQNIYDADQP